MTTPFTLNLPMPDGDPLTLALPPSDYPPEVVLGALATYAETGNQTAAALTVNVSHDSVGKWVKTEQASTLLASLRSAIRFNYAHTIGRNIGTSLACMEDRLVNGDMILTRQGTLRAIPVKAKDAAVIASILIDKYQLLIGGITEDATIGRLDAIAARLEAAASKHGANKPEVIDVTPEGVPLTLGPNEGDGGEKQKEGNNA